MLALLRTFSWQELRHHPWRSAAAVAAVMLGVALAFAVHVIDTSALDEFSQAVRAVNGQPDLELRAMQGPLPEALYAQLANHPQVARASPWLELSTMAQVDAPPAPQPPTPPATRRRRASFAARRNDDVAVAVGAHAGYEPGFLHLFQQPRGAVVTNAQVALHQRD